MKPIFPVLSVLLVLLACKSEPQQETDSAYLGDGIRCGVEASGFEVESDEGTCHKCEHACDICQVYCDSVPQAMADAVS